LAVLAVLAALAISIQLLSNMVADAGLKEHVAWPKARRDDIAKTLYLWAKPDPFIIYAQPAVTSLCLDCRVNAPDITDAFTPEKPI
jgi:hypothetical protein